MSTPTQCCDMDRMGTPTQYMICLVLWIPICKTRCDGGIVLVSLMVLLMIEANGALEMSTIEECMENLLCFLFEKNFDVIVGMDWLSKRKFMIVCHEKVVRIPLEGDEILRVHGERTQGVVKTLMNTKSKEENEVHFKLVLKSLRKEKLYVKFSKCEFWLEEVHFLGHVVACSIRRDWESSLTGPELVLEMTDKVVLIKEKLKAAIDHQKSYADKRSKPLEFEVGPFEILERIILVAYRLRLPEELNSVHDTFHVSNLKKCLADANLHVPLDEIKVDKILCFVEEPIEVMD
ncbi:hypothetical protein Tco_0708832 [Tanacetum coccineum]